MSAYYYHSLPLTMQGKFIAVRTASDNLYNLLKVAEIILSCNDCRVEYGQDFDIVVFTGAFKRVLVRKTDGYFTMNFPFKIIDQGDGISLSYDEFQLGLDLRAISMLRNAIQTCNLSGYSHEEIILSLMSDFNSNLRESIEICDAFSALISDDHGYFRFDDDPINQNGKIHPRYHFDFFFKNTSSVKVGVDAVINHDFFYPLFDANQEKHYIGR